MTELAVDDEGLKGAKGGTHALRPLPELHKVFFDRRLAETGRQEPRLELLKIPAIKPDLDDAMLCEDLAEQKLRDVLILDRAAGRRQQGARVMPEIIRNPIGAGLFDKALRRQPRHRFDADVSRRGIAPRQNKRGQIADGA